MPVTTSEIAKLMQPMIMSVFGQSLKRHDPIAIRIFETHTTVKNFEDDLEITGLTVSAEKAQGASIAFDDFSQSFVHRYTPLAYALGMTITREALDDNLYKGQMKSGAALLARSDAEARELNGHNVLVRAFNSAYTGGDGIQLISTAHVNKSGGTYSNRMATDADISEAAIDELRILVERWEDDRGLRINAKLKDLWLPPDIAGEAHRILMSNGQVNTAENNANYLKDAGIIKSINVSPYLPDIDAFFATTDIEGGLKYVERQRPIIEQDNDFFTKSLHYSVMSRYVFGWSNPKGIVGSGGA
jgi:hypothetical protein